MITQRFWFRELEAAGQGPDWVFNARFESAEEALLSAAFRAHVPAGFAHYRATQAPCPIHQGRCDYDLYVDAAQYAALIAQVEGRTQENIYIYHTLQACRNDYQIVRGYGGYSGQYGAVETAQLRALAATPQLTLAAWSLVYGGVTYPYAEWRRGTGSAELLDYLDQPGGGYGR